MPTIEALHNLCRVAGFSEVRTVIGPPPPEHQLPRRGARLHLSQPTSDSPPTESADVMRYPASRLTFFVVVPITATGHGPGQTTRGHMDPWPYHWAVVAVRLLDVPDGRTLAWAEYGVREGAPVMAFHGSSGSHHHFAGLSDVAATKGTRLIATDRPGYGQSSFDRGRSYESWARDVGRLADHLGVDRFAVIGHSSGGPNAAGCARFLGDRLAACAIISGPAPPEAHISKREMLRSNRIAQRGVRLAPRLMGAVFGAGLRQGARAPDKALAWMHRTLPACDVAVIGRPEIRAAVRDDIASPSSTAGRAAVQDLRLELRPWGFRLRDIAVPVQVWHGNSDRNVVVENGVYQANEIPHATLHEVSGEGHWLYCDHFPEILDSLSA